MCLMITVKTMEWEYRNNISEMDVRGYFATYTSYIPLCQRVTHGLPYQYLLSFKTDYTFWIFRFQIIFYFVLDNGCGQKKWRIYNKIY